MTIPYFMIVVKLKLYYYSSHDNEPCFTGVFLKQFTKSNVTEGLYRGTHTKKNKQKMKTKADKDKKISKGAKLTRLSRFLVSASSVGS